MKKIVDFFDNLNSTIKLVLLILLTIGIMAGAFYIKRYVNYTFFYQDSVQTEMAPLEKRVKTIEENQERILDQQRKILLKLNNKG